MSNLEVVLYIAVIIAFVIMVFLLFRFGKKKLDRVIDLDAQYEQYYENGNLKQKTNTRPVWDYSPCPGISKILHRREWLAPLVMILFFVILVFYLKTRDALLADLLKYNFGAFLGTMTQGLVGKKS